MNKKTTLLAALLLSGAYYAQEQNATEQTTEIQSVTIKKKAIVKKADRLIFDVANSPLSKGTTTSDVLRETPMLSSTDGKTFQILGKNNAVIYINGRKSNMSAEAVADMLKSTPAENIAKIEVITVPSSEFPAEANEGIINIILKKKPSDGYNGNMRLENSQTVYNVFNGSATLNYRQGKLGANGNIYAGEWKQLQDYKLENGLTKNVDGADNRFKNTSTGSVMDPNTYVGGYLNLDYALTDRQTLGLNYNSRYNVSNNTSSDFINDLILLNSGERILTRTTNDENSTNTDHSVNLNYELKTDDKGSKLSINTSYLNHKKTQENFNTTFSLDNDLNETGILANFRQDVPLDINNYGAMADYIKKFDKDLTISIGGSYNATETDSQTLLENILPPTGIDPNQTNHFVYTEKITGLYATAEKNFSPKFSGKIGTRYEITDSKGTVVDKNDSFERNSGDFLPYISLNFTPDNKNNLSFAFSSRVQRPSFWQLNPSRIYLTQTNYVQNNPFTKAATYYNSEFTYMYKGAYFLTLGHNYIKNPSDQIPLQKNIDGQNVLRYIRTNYDNKQEFSLGLGMQKQFFDGIWGANYNLNTGLRTFDGVVDRDPITGESFTPFVLSKETGFLMFQANNNIRLSKQKDWYLGVNYFYLAPMEIEMGELMEMYSLDLSVKKIYKDWTFMLEGKDVLGTRNPRINSYQDSGYYNTVVQDQHNRQLKISATYTFGNQKVEKVRNINSANSEIQSRTGN